MVLFSTLFLRNNLIPQVIETNLKRRQMETMQKPREGKTSCTVLGKMSIQEKKLHNKPGS